MVIIYELCDKCKKHSTCKECTDDGDIVQCDDYERDETIEISFGSQNSYREMRKKFIEKG